MVNNGTHSTSCVWSVVVSARSAFTSSFSLSYGCLVFVRLSLSLIIWQRSLSLSCILCFIKSAMSTILYMIFIIIGNKIYRDIKHQTPLFMLLVCPCYPVSDIKFLFSRTKMSLTTAKADTKSFFLNSNFVCVCCISISCLHWLVFFCIFVNFVKH